MKQFKPLGDRVLVKPIKVSETKSSGGIIVSESMTEAQILEGEVIEVGTGIFSQNGSRIPMTVKRGDIVIYEKAQANNRIKLEGETHFLFNEHTLLGIKGWKY